MSSLTRSPVWGGESEHGLVPSAGPDGGVDRVEQGLHLCGGEVGQVRSRVFLDGDRLDRRDGVEVFGHGRAVEGQQGLDRGQPQVAGGDAVAAFVLEVVEELGDATVVDVWQFECVGRQLRAFGDEGQQQGPAVAVGPDRGCCPSLNVPMMPSLSIPTIGTWEGPRSVC